MPFAKRSFPRAPWGLRSKIHIYLTGDHAIVQLAAAFGLLPKCCSKSASAVIMYALRTGFHSADGPAYAQLRRGKVAQALAIRRIGEHHRAGGRKTPSSAVKEPAVLFHARQLCIGRSQRHRRRVNVKTYALKFHARRISKELSPAALSRRRRALKRIVFRRKAAPRTGAMFMAFIAASIIQAYRCRRTGPAPVCRDRCGPGQ